MDLEGPVAHRQVSASGHISLSWCYYSKFKSHTIWKGQETKCSLDTENASMIHDNHEFFSTLTFTTTMFDSKLSWYYAKSVHVALVLRTPNKWCTINRWNDAYSNITMSLSPVEIKNEPSNASYLGGAQSCRVQSNRVPTYVLFLQVTLTTSMPVRHGIYFVLTTTMFQITQKEIWTQQSFTVRFIYTCLYYVSKKCIVAAASIDWSLLKGVTCKTITQVKDPFLIFFTQ